MIGCLKIANGLGDADQNRSIDKGPNKDYSQAQTRPRTSRKLLRSSTGCSIRTKKMGWNGTDVSCPNV